MKTIMSYLGGLGLGAGLMYFLDPERGRRRRSVLRGKIQRAVHQIECAAEVTARDVAHRTQGIIARLRAAGEHDVPDDVLVERVRSALGRVVSQPHAIHADARNGSITLSGAIRPDEIDDLVGRVLSVPGVRKIENQLAVEEGDHSWHGGRTKPGNRRDWQQANWSPATRLAASAVGAGLIVNCLVRRTPGAALLGTAGFGLFLRGLTNVELRRLVGVSCGRRAVDVAKTINIRAPIEKVYEFWTNYENFPRFMSHLYEVRDLGHGRSHWIAAGPAGAPVTWNAVLTRVEHHERLAWKSEPGSMIASAGTVRFIRISPSQTRIDIRLSYNPPAGVLGHFAAWFFGADPKSAMDDDLMRLKSMLENGKSNAPGKWATTEELPSGESNSAGA